MAKKTTFKRTPILDGTWVGLLQSLKEKSLRRMTWDTQPKNVTLWVSIDRH